MSRGQSDRPLPPSNETLSSFQPIKGCSDSCTVGYEFRDNFWDRTIVSEYGLVCEDKGIAGTVCKG